MPYYIFKNLKFAASGRFIVANFGLKQIITDPNKAQNIQAVSIFINTTRFANFQQNIAKTTLTGSQIDNMSSIRLIVQVPQLRVKQSFVFARVGVKIKNVEDRLFSKVVKVQLPQK